MRIKEIINLAMQELSNIEDSGFKIRMILMNILNVSKEYLIIHDNEAFPENKMQELKEKLKRLRDNEPVQYIVNKQSFFGYDFYVDKNVLIPQPDTEILVEETIKIYTEVQEMYKKNIKILDLCTGSGAIAICLKKESENAAVFASDISKKALEVAIKNANNNQAEIKFIHSNLFDKIEDKFDMIVSNPPYIKTKVIETLSEEVKNEPYIALDGGEDGLMFYNEIIKSAKFYLNTNGYLLLEIGFDQKEDVINILRENGYKNIYSKKDFGDNDRIVVAQI